MKGFIFQMQSVVIINLFWIPLGLFCFHSDISQIQPDLVDLIFSWVSSALLHVSPLTAWLFLFPPCVYSCLSGTVWIESALYTSVVEQGGGWGGIGEGVIALTRSVKTHPFLSLLCPCSPPPVSSLSPSCLAPCCDAMQAFCTAPLLLSYYLWNLKKSTQQPCLPLHWWQRDILPVQHQESSARVSMIWSNFLLWCQIT